MVVETPLHPEARKMTTKARVRLIGEAFVPLSEASRFAERQMWQLSYLSGLPPVPSPSLITLSGV